MIRFFILGAAAVALTACADGRGSQYSSLRAEAAAPTYIPVTPGATPVGTQAQVPAAVPVTAAPLANQTNPGLVTQPAPAVLTEPIAITPGAVPVTEAATAPVTQAAVVTAPLAAPTVDITAQAPAVSLKPQTAPRGGQAQIVRASAPAAVATAPRRSNTVTGRKFARGPIYSACRSAGRKEATDRRCGCVQWVADRELTASQQKRGAGYFNNQQGVQDARQSDRATDERFWTAWKSFGQSAGQQCRSS